MGSLIGGIILILAEAQAEDNRLIAGLEAGLPYEKETTPKTYMQLIGRGLLILMILVRMDFTADLTDITMNLIGCIVLILIMIGFKTKLVSLIVAILLTFHAFYTFSLYLRNPEFLANII